MAETAMASALRRAGVNTDAALVRVMAEDELRKVELVLPRAIAPFIEELRDAGGLLGEVVTAEHIRKDAETYLARVLADMRNEKSGGGGAQAWFDVQDDDSAPSPLARKAVEGGAHFEGESRFKTSAPSPAAEKTVELGARHKTETQQYSSANSPVAISAGEGAQVFLESQKRNCPLPAEINVRKFAPNPPLRTLANLTKMNSVLSQNFFDSIKLRNGIAIGDLPWSALDRFIGDNAYEAALLRLVRDHARVSNPSTKVRDVIKLADFERMVQKAKEIADGA